MKLKRKTVEGFTNRIDKVKRVSISELKMWHLGYNKYKIIIYAQKKICRIKPQKIKICISMVGDGHPKT